MRILCYNLYWKVFSDNGGDIYNRCMRNSKNICMKNIKSIILEVGKEPNEIYPNYDFMAFQEVAVKKIYQIDFPKRFIGNYNYIFFFDGGLNQISPPMAVPSSPYSELSVQFENVTTPSYKDILIDYKIINSSYRNYYSVMEHTPTQVFQWKTYGNIGKSDAEILYLELSTGSIGLAKDILIYEGNLDNASELKDAYNFKAKISKKDKLLHRFFYFENERKYFTKK